MLFKREFSYYLILIYVPCCMMVIVSWVSFWIDPNSTAARVTLGIITILSMSRQISGINASLPPVSYTKAVDVWTGACLTFVFSALIEFAVVNYVSRQDAHKADRKRRKNLGSSGPMKNRNLAFAGKGNGMDSGIDSDDIDSDSVFKRTRNGNYSNGTSLMKPDHAPNFIRKWLNRFPTRPKRVDIISRIGFPILFAIFNFFYWVNYLWRDDLKDLDI